MAHRSPEVHFLAINRYYFSKNVSKKSIIITIEKGQTWISLIKGCFVPSLVEMAEWLWSRRFFNAVYVFLLLTLPPYIIWKKLIINTVYPHVFESYQNQSICHRPWSRGSRYPVLHRLYNHKVFFISFFIYFIF